MHINCCNANGPRAFALIPAFAYQVKDDAIHVNLYTPSTVDVQLPGKKTVTLKQTTDYPVTNQIIMEVNPAKASEFALLLRIPAWSQEVNVAVNGKVQTGCLQGSYYTIRRKWDPGDQVTLTFDLRARLVELNQTQAIVRGPIVLARDSRFGDGDVRGGVGLTEF